MLVAGFFHDPVNDQSITEKGKKVSIFFGKMPHYVFYNGLIQEEKQNWYN